MKNINVDFIVSLSKLNTVLSKDFDGKLGGIGLTDFIVLYHLNDAKGKKMRRIDLADKVGMTPSGVTRLLLPMEKIGLVSKELNFDDARVSLVSLAPAGKKLFKEAVVRIDEICEDVIPEKSEKDIKKFIKLMKEIGGRLLWD